MRTVALALVALGVVACGASHPNRAAAATTNATTANLQSVFNSAQPGDVITLASGSYGNFSGGAKSGMVTIKPQDGASVTMSPSFNGAANITVQNMTLSGLSISGRTHDIKILNNTFTGQANLNMAGNANANILVDGNSFDNISVCASCAEGRLEVGQYPLGSAPVGVTISHNHFGGGGQSDGVQDGAYGVVIDGNEFDGIVQANGYTRHVDSIQLYGASHTTIVNNYLHNFTTAIMAPDGGDHEVISNNVFINPGSTGSAIQFGHQNSTTFTHNLVKNTDVDAFVSSGDDDPNRSMVLRDNAMVNAAFVASGCSGCTNAYNLYTRNASGTSALTGTPRFAGGASPTTYAGWALASGSPGKGNASDGTDRGINPGASTPPAGGSGTGAGSTPGGTTTGGTPATGATTTSSTAAVAPTLTTVSDPASAAAGNAAAAISARWTMKPSKPRVNQRVVLTAPKTRAGGRRCTWTVGKGVYRKGCQIAVRFGRAGRKHISVRIVDRSGTITRAVRDITIVRRATAAKKHPRAKKA
jgi:hypothetical protein